MFSIDKLKLSGKKINILVSTFLIGLILFDFLSQENILKNNFFYSGRTLFSDLVVIIPNLEELAKWNLFDSNKISSTELFNSNELSIIWVYIFHFISSFGNPVIILGITQLIIYTFLQN